MNGPEGVHLSRLELVRQFASYFQQIGIESVPRGLGEFDLLYKAEDYAAAADVLNQLETLPLEKGRYMELARCYEQLDGKLEDRQLVRHVLDKLARIYHRLGELDRAAEKYQKGLQCVRDAGDRSGECRYLANLAICKQESGDFVAATLYCMAVLELAQQIGDNAWWEAHIWNVISETLASQGLISDAKQVSEHALKLACDNDQREIEVVALANLAQHYEALGNVDHAQGECNRAYRIAQSIGFQLGESAASRNLGILNLSWGRYQLATKDLTKAMRLADVTQSVQLQQTIRIELAMALLLSGKLCEAEATVEEAVQYDAPLFNPEAHALRGVVWTWQGKMREAAESFYEALKHAEVVVKRSSQYYRGLDVMGLSYSGLTLSEETGEYLDKAIEAYEAARLITNEPGIVRRRLLLFDALAQVDSGRKLALVRNAIDPGQ